MKQLLSAGIILLVFFGSCTRVVHTTATQDGCVNDCPAAAEKGWRYFTSEDLTEHEATGGIYNIYLFNSRPLGFIKGLQTVSGPVYQDGYVVRQKNVKQKRFELCYCKGGVFHQKTETGELVVKWIDESGEEIFLFWTPESYNGIYRYRFYGYLNDDFITITAVTGVTAYLAFVDQTNVDAESHKRSLETAPLGK